MGAAGAVEEEPLPLQQWQQRVQLQRWQRERCHCLLRQHPPSAVDAQLFVDRRRLADCRRVARSSRMQQVHQLHHAAQPLLGCIPRTRRGPPPCAPRNTHPSSQSSTSTSTWPTYVDVPHHRRQPPQQLPPQLLPSLLPLLPLWQLLPLLLPVVNEACGGGDGW